MKNSFAPLIAAIVFAVSIQSAASIHAENLVTNGNFATGDFTGWNHGSGPVVQSTGIGQSYGVFLDQGRQDEFSQSLSTVVGQEYLITFWIAKDLSNCTDLTPGSSCSLMAEFGAATVFALGVCFFWPTMLGFVSENFPKTGALGLAIMGGAGMLSVSFVLPVMGRVFDTGIAARLPAGHTGESLPGAEWMQIQAAAGLETLGRVAVLPVVLAVVFALLLVAHRKAPAK